MDSFYYFTFESHGAIMKEEIILIIGAMAFLLTIKLMGWI